MGSVVELGAWKAERREEGCDALARLEGVVERLAALTATERASKRVGGSQVETELLAILGEISLGRVDEAAARAERLAKGLGV